MARRLLFAPLTLLLAAPACDQPEGTCGDVPAEAEGDDADHDAAEEEHLRLTNTCGFAPKYSGEAVQEDGTTLEVQVFSLGPFWALVGVIHEEGVEPFPYLVSIQPDGCSGEFDGLWGVEGQSAWFVGRLTPERVEFSTYIHTVSERGHWNGPEVVPVSIE